MANLSSSTWPNPGGEMVGQDRPTLVLTGESTPVRSLIGDVVRQWRLLPLLASQDFHARYRSATLGLLWSVLLPLVQGGVLAIVFTQVVHVSAGVNYTVFIVAGITVWAYFLASLSAGSTAIVDTGAIAGKVYFPRLILPAVPAAANMVGFAISMGVAVLLAVGFGIPVRAHLLVLPLAMIGTFLLATLLSAVTTLLHVYFRDTRYVVQAVLLVWFYATPIFYPLSYAKGLRPLLEANPVTGIMQLVRWCFFGQADGLAVSVAVTAVWMAVLGVITVAAYARYERVACDRL